MSLDSISEYLFVKMFLGGMPQTPSISMLCMLIVLHTTKHNHSCTMKLHFDYVACLQAPSYAPIKYY